MATAAELAEQARAKAAAGTGASGTAMERARGFAAEVGALDKNAPDYAEKTIALQEKWGMKPGGGGGLLGDIAGADPTGLTGRAFGAVGLISPADQSQVYEAMRAGDKRRAETLYQEALARAKTAGAQFTPQQAQEQFKAIAEGIEAPNVQRGFDATAASSDPVERYTAALAGIPDDVSLGAVPYGYEAPEIGDAALTRGTTVERTKLSDEARALRGMQLDAARDVREGPSAAPKMLEAALAKSMRDKLGAAARARGVERTGLLRESIISSGEDAVQAGALAAAEAAREEQAKRMGAANLLGNIRSSDVEVATTDANLMQQANQLQAQIDAAAARGDADAVNNLRIQQARLIAQARETTSAQGVDVAKARADVAGASAARRLTGNIANAGAVNDASKFGASAANARSENEAERKTRVDLENKQRAQQLEVEIARQKMEAAKFNSAERNQAEREWVAAKNRENETIRELNFRTAQAKAAEEARARGEVRVAHDDLRGFTEAKIADKKGHEAAKREADDRFVKFGTTAAGYAFGGPAGGATAGGATGGGSPLAHAAPRDRDDVFRPRGL